MGYTWILPGLAILGLYQFYTLKQSSSLILFGFATALLLCFSILISFMIRSKKKSAAELMARTISFWWMLTAFMIAVLTDRIVSYLLLFLLANISTFEYLRFEKNRSSTVDWSLKILIFLMIPCNLALQYFNKSQISDTFIIFSILGILSSTLVLGNKKEGQIVSYGKYSQAILFFVYSFGIAGAIVNRDISLLLICVLLTELRDLISYWLGKLTAKTNGSKSNLAKFINLKIADQVSPNKTWFVGILSTLAICLIVASTSDLILPTIWQGRISGAFFIGWAACIGIAGLFGDLVFSMIKRSYHLKDSGKSLPGGEGVLDRIDSLLLTFPTTYLLIFIFYPN